MPPRAAAIVVGIDGYPKYPLTSAGNDAGAFRDALIQHGLVDAKDIQLIPGKDATKRAILDAVKPYYTKGEQVPRFYFYFAGHGCLGYVDPARSRTHTCLCPVDFDDFDHADLLIDLDEIVERMHVAGPQEQFFFIDACRDIPYDEVPNISPIAWPAAPPGVPRAQAVLFAVSPFGQAVGTRGGMGVMTTHLVAALKGTGTAVDYSSASDEYVITAQSICEYAAGKVRKAVSGEPQWEQKVSLPQLRAGTPATRPIRTLATVPAARLTVHIDPDDAAAKTKVTLSQSRIVAQTWPPNANHVPVEVQPQRHVLEATSTAGEVDPARASIDAREITEATVRVRAGRPGGPKGVRAAPGATSRVTAERRRLTRDAPAVRTGTITAAAREAQVAIELEGLAPPYVRHAGRVTLTQSLAPGPYRVSFRLGSDVFSRTDVDVREGEMLTVHPMVASSALVREALGEQAQQETAIISETIGPIQAGVVETMLPIIGLKLFDTHEELFGRFAGVVPTLDPVQFARTPVAVVVAVDGDGWPVSPAEILEAIRLDIVVGGAAAPPAVLAPLKGPGYERVLVGAHTAPGHSYFVRIASPHLGRVLVATSAIRDRATVLTARFTPEGRLEISQNLLRLPGFAYDEPDPQVPPGRVIRQLQLGQKLYQSGELTGPGPALHDMDLIHFLFYAKWTDPILGCMAYYALREAAGTDAEAKRMYDDYAPEVARNLVRYFSGLPDSRIVHALAVGDAAQLDQMLETRELPVLARSAQELAAHAEARAGAPAERSSVADQITRGPANISEFARRIPVDSPWAILREVASSSGAAARRVVAVEG